MHWWTGAGIWLALLGGIVMSASCGGGGGGRDPEETIPVDEQSLSRGGRGARAAGMSLPEGFPHDVPLYAPATVIRSAALPLPEVRLRTGDAADAIIAFYRRVLPVRGWVERPEQEWTLPTGDEILAFQKGRDMLTVRVAAGEKATVVILRIAVLG